MTADTEKPTLQERLGPNLYEQRLYIQLHHATKIFMSGRNHFRIENAQLLDLFAVSVLKLTGLYGRAYRNYHTVRVVENEVNAVGMPQSLDGFRILHLSDLHLDLAPDLVKTLPGVVADLDYDLCVITGDFRSAMAGDHALCCEMLARVVEKLHGPIYGILGNHDFIEMVPSIEALGVEVLLNENVRIERDGEAIYVVGIDDPYLYETDNFEKARTGIPWGAYCVLLSHSPETYRRASACGFNLLLAGHTHGGQVCLPGGIAIAKHGQFPRRMINGAWEYQKMQGYTSPGTGSCGAPIRLFCPPEVTIHTLRATDEGV
jgi:hypothetical protein